jgi:predicted RNA-binding protein YlxR (DUF448 family)
MGSRMAVEGADAEAADKGPLRYCVVSRVQKPPEELIRFVAGPDLAVVPDLARRLPGRGVWVEATRETVAEAMRRKAFARSLKKNVSVPADLPELVERSASPIKRAFWSRALPRWRSRLRQVGP